MSKFDDEFLFNVLAVVEEIPEGKVATYGQIAKLIGMEKNSRLVGTALKFSSNIGKYPCHRVVNSQGRLVPGWIEQKTLLKKEKISFNINGYVNLKKHRWENS